jgi:putative PIG3 family NAD(P)H quinone oxidoreductase
MKAIVVTHPGGPEVLKLQEVPDPEPGPLEVLVDVTATAVNRADIGQRLGNYPPPPGFSPYLGLECSGTIAALGAGVSGWQVGDRVAALLAGGGYAERVAVPASQLMPASPAVSLVENAGIPETCCTVHSMIFNDMISPGRLRPGETLLVHGGSSGIGTTAIQMAKAHGARVAVTVGTDAKVAACEKLGADLAINYRTQNFGQRVREKLGGADVILDIIGAPYFAENVATLRPHGRLIMIAQLGGGIVETDLGRLQMKWGTVHGGSLRARSAEEKATVVAATHEFIAPLLASGQLRPVVERVMGLEDAAEAHRLVESSGHVGKVLLRV